jgi:uncharacterized protein with HEPN domain
LKRRASLSKREPSLLIEDIGEAIEKIERYISGMTKDSFMGDDKTIDAVVRNIEIIGEASRQMLEAFKGYTMGSDNRVT